MTRPLTKADPTGTALNRGNVDPGNTDLTKPKRKRRKKRKLAEPHPDLKANKAAMLTHAHSRPVPPTVMLEPAGFDEEHLTAPHNDLDLWSLQFADAFGTRSHAVIATFLDQLEKLCGRNIWDDEEHQWRLNEQELSAALAIVNAAKPRNEIEACLAAQMCAVHMMQMKCSARALKYDHDTQTAAVAGKLARTFADQMRTMHEIKGRKKPVRQSIKVTKELHQHVHYHREGQENGSRPDETSRTDTTEECAALPGPSEGDGQVLPFSRAEESNNLQDARIKGGRPKG